MDENVTDQVVFAQPNRIDDRRSIASQCCQRLKLTMPCVVDEIDNRVDTLYAAWPERMYVIDAGGRIVYAGRRGPWGFRPDELDLWLRKNL